MISASFLELFGGELIKKEGLGVDFRIGLFVGFSFEDEDVIGVLF